MTEVIGVVSDDITFATVIVQLKDCWDQIRDAPEGLRKLMQQVELFSPILADIEEDVQQESFLPALNVSKHTPQSFGFSKAATRGLEAICKDLSRDG
ncbi:hypothetical protein N7463_005018 [Penicillium fimorum]|uniref:Uncharacterized protein n=1 Tax=Penicillium fimorum TaxID=1882269 RepID=A0A9X0C4P5_9EURO|nr:hypothetical protein N7463_005018 [Penicillium fimorum]